MQCLTVNHLMEFALQRRIQRNLFMVPIFERHSALFMVINVNGLFSMVELENPLFFLISLNNVQLNEWIFFYEYHGNDSAFCILYNQYSIKQPMTLQIQRDIHNHCSCLMFDLH